MIEFKKIGLLVFALAIITACDQQQQSKEIKQEVTLSLTEVSTPADTATQTPNLFSNGQQLYFSWTGKLANGNHALYYTQLENNAWSAPQIIAQGKDWFVNWADFPAMAVTETGWKAAHWLAKSDLGTYDYNVNIATTNAGQENWQAPFIPHTNTLPAEYGFVSMLPFKEEVMAVWLDGRFTKAGENAPNGGAMTLRTGTFDQNGHFSSEVLLDERVCDCCQTDLINTPKGTLTVYRNRTENEIRDIYFSFKTDSAWTKPQAVYNDNWQISGCPVNGPAAAASANNVAVAWFAAPEGTASIKVAFYQEAQQAFEEPILISQANAETKESTPLGRVDIVMKDNESVWVSWVETVGNKTAIKLAEVNKQAGKIWEKTLVETSSARSSGFPVMEKLNDQVWLVWTDTELNKVRSAYLPIVENEGLTALK